MGKISFEDVEQYESKNSGPKGYKFFGLKNDGDSAIVRILHQSKADLDINVIHKVPVDGKDRRISCLRDPKDPSKKCPLCEAGTAVQVRTFVHLLVYEKDENGNQVKVHKVFDRGRDFIQKIQNLSETYPPLYDTLFKVVRNGKAGDQTTTYDFMPLPPQTFNSTNYPYTPEDLQYDSVCGTAVWEKTAAEMENYLVTGTFPLPNKKPEQTQTEQVEPRPTVAPETTVVGVTNPSYAQPATPNNYDMPIGPRRRI